MLTDIKTILYATDLGDNTRPAFRMAMSIANKYQAHVVLVHAIEPLSVNAQALVSSYLPEGSLKEMRKKGIEKLKNTVEERLEAFCREEMPEGAGFPKGEPEQHIVEEDAARAILKLADQCNADLIVMGTHSHSTLGEFLLGSAANKVIHNSKRPVLMVPLGAAH